MKEESPFDRKKERDGKVIEKLNCIVVPGFRDQVSE